MAGRLMSGRRFLMSSDMTWRGFLPRMGMVLVKDDVVSCFVWLFLMDSRGLGPLMFCNALF